MNHVSIHNLQSIADSMSNKQRNIALKRSLGRNRLRFHDQLGENMRALLLVFVCILATFWLTLGVEAEVSRDGEVLTAGRAGTLVTNAGIWSFSNQKGTDGNLILLNARTVPNGSATELIVDDGGQLYAHGKSGIYFLWSGSGWLRTGRFDPIRTECTTAVVVGLEWRPELFAVSYQIFRDGALLATTGLNWYSDQGVSASTTYSYEIAALDIRGRTIGSHSLDVTTAAASPLGDPAVCPSKVISQMTWNWSTGANQQNGSDLWPSTWGGDGNIYTFFGDGGGFFGGDQLGRSSFGIAEITAPAPPPDTVPVLMPDAFFNIYGGYSTTHPSTINGKVNDILAVGNDFYALGGTYQAGIDAGGPSGAPDHYEIIYSKGNPYSWQSNYSKWYFCDDFSGADSLCPVAFVNSGKGNQSPFDRYVYMMAVSDGNFFGDGGLCSCTYLMRVARDKLLIKTAYEVFTGTDLWGNPKWNSTWTAAQPIFEDKGPRPMHLKKMVYNAKLNRFISLAQGNRVNETSFYDSPTPWGPFTVIGYYPSNLDHTGGWGNLGSAAFAGNTGSTLGVNFINKWTSADGLTMWAAFSSTKLASPSADLIPLANASMDSYSLVSTTLTLRHPHAISFR
jgi:hypothetical protein